MSSSFPTVSVRQTIASMEHATLHQNAQLWVAQPLEHVPSPLESAVSSALAVGSLPPTTTPMPSSHPMLLPQIQILAHTKFASSQVMFAK